MKTTVSLLLLISSLHAINSYPATDASTPKPSISQYMAIALQKLEEDHINLNSAVSAAIIPGERSHTRVVAK